MAPQKGSEPGRRNPTVLVSFRLLFLIFERKIQSIDSVRSPILATSNPNGQGGALRNQQRV
jgi:hypothetical protein